MLRCSTTTTTGSVDFAVCVTIEDNPAVQSVTSPRIFTCGDDKVDRCTTPSPRFASPTSTCTVGDHRDATVCRRAKGHPNDTTATCTIRPVRRRRHERAARQHLLHPSNKPNSDPSDCVLIIRDGFLRIVKNASPNDTGAPVQLLPGRRRSPPCSRRTAAGRAASSRSTTRRNPHSLTETAPAGWTLAERDLQQRQPDQRDRVPSDETVICTFNNVRQTGKLEVKKSLSPTRTPASSTFRSTARPTRTRPTSATTARPARRRSHRQPHGRRDRRHEHQPGRLPEVDRVQAPTTAPAPSSRACPPTAPGR